MAQYTNKQIDPNTGIASVTLDGIQFTNIDLSEGSKPIADFKIHQKILYSILLQIYKIIRH